MEFLIIASDQSHRAVQFQQFLAGRGHRGRRIAVGQRIPAAEQCWLGAVCFDGDTDHPTLVHAIQESVRYLGIPLAVVAPIQPKLQTQVRAAGAELICDAATPDAQILDELQSRCHIHELAPNLQKDLGDPLVTAVAQTLSQMAGVEVMVHSLYQRNQPTSLGDLSVTLTLSGSLEGLLILSFSMSTAEALARRILADAAAELDPVMVKDCIGEIANIIAGQAKALFHGTANHFVFSTPSVTIGAQGALFKNGMTSVVIAFGTEHGGFALQLCRA